MVCEKIGRCDQCAAIMINGVYCHETGCSDAWKGVAVDCFECGCDFVPESRHQRTCDDCKNPPSDFDGCGDDDWCDG